MDASNKNALTISTGTIIRVFAVAILCVALYYIRNVVLILLASLVIASAIEPAVRWLSKLGLPRVLSVISVYLSIAACFFVVTFIFVPPMLTELSRLSNFLPNYLENISIPDVFSGKGSVVGDQFLDSISIKTGIEQLRVALSGLSQGFFHTASLLFGGAFSAILVLVISFYLAVEERGVENFLRVILPIEKEKYVISLWRRSQDKIGLWLQGQVILGVVVGVLVYLSLTILNVPYATTLAAIAGLLEVIPIFGPVISAIPAALFGFSVSTSLGLMVIGLFIIIQQFENHLIYPLVVTKIVGIPPIIVIVALLIGGELAGILGVLLAVPLTTVLVELFNDLEKYKFSPPNPQPNV
ncbi:MAG TPA: AI-2E family transporter [Candidatus Paceibacterota bacterium]